MKRKRREMEIEKCNCKWVFFRCMLFRMMAFFFRLIILFFAVLLFCRFWCIQSSTINVTYMLRAYYILFTDFKFFISIKCCEHTQSEQEKTITTTIIASTTAAEAATENETTRKKRANCAWIISQCSSHRLWYVCERVERAPHSLYVCKCMLKRMESRKQRDSKSNDNNSIK